MACSRIQQIIDAAIFAFTSHQRQKCSFNESVIRNAIMTKFDTENKDAPNQMNSLVTSETRKRHVFITVLSFHAKSPYHIIIISNVTFHIYLSSKLCL